MASVTVELPSLLTHLNDGRDTLAVDAASLSAAFADIVRQCPSLEVHLFDETGGLRQHVLCFHNDANTRWLESDVPLEDGDRIRIYQAVSGG